MRALIAVLIAICSSAVLAADPSGATKVSIKWDGSYSYNRAALYNMKQAPNSNANIRAGHSQNFQNGAEQEIGRVSKEGNLIAWLWMPPGAIGPFPFVVFLHGCGGIGYSHSWAANMAKRLNAEGIGLLSLDSFTTRMVTRVCDAAGGHWMRRRADDAYSALDHLVEQKLAKPGEVVLVGHSNGASTTLIAAEERYRQRRNHFAAFASLEPTCRTMSQPFYAPVHLFLAELDEWAAPKFCFELVKARTNHKHPIQVTVIKGAHHGYLFPGLGAVHVSNLNGFRLGYDPIGARVGDQLLLAFFNDPKVERKISQK